MRTICEKSKSKSFVHIPRMSPKLQSLGLEGRRLLERFEDYCHAMNQHAKQFDLWRNAMVELLLQSLIDQEDDAELEGNEYETSINHQDEVYVYMEVLRAMFADRHQALTDQINTLIAHEVQVGINKSQKGEGHAPELYLSMMGTRSAIKPDPKVGSLQGIISELRSLVTSLDWQESGGSSRARIELELVSDSLRSTSQMAIDHIKVISSLEKEVGLFRDTMNLRLEYYRQLQHISDTVAPYGEESLGNPLNEELFREKLESETVIDEKLSALRAKGRYLIHLRDEPIADESARSCVVCQTPFEIG